MRHCSVGTCFCAECAAHGSFLLKYNKSLPQKVFWTQRSFLVSGLRPKTLWETFKQNLKLVTRVSNVLSSVADLNRKKKDMKTFTVQANSLLHLDTEQGKRNKGTEIPYWWNRTQQVEHRRTDSSFYLLHINNRTSWQYLI